MKPILLALLLAAGGAAWALEAGFEFRSTNLAFPWDWTSPLASSVTSFPSDNLFFGGQLWISEGLGEDALLRVAYDLDPVLRNSVTAAVEFERGIARIEVGPRLGLFNSDSIPFSAGLASSIRLQWPGVAYVSLRSEGGMSIGAIQSKVDPQARAELAAGFYVRNAIVSAIIEAKRFNDVDSGGDLASTDSLTRYALEFDIFKKGVPYTLLCSLGYEQRSKHYEAEDATDSLGALVFGTEAKINTNKGFTLSAGLDAGFYVFGFDELSGRSPATSSFMFSASVGMSFDVNALSRRVKAIRAAREEAAKAAAARAAASADEAAPAASPPAADAPNVDQQSAAAEANAPAPPEASAP
jgi:hypothetical protein